MKIGSLVELVDDKWPTTCGKFPIKGFIYTVLALEILESKPCIQVEEVQDDEVDLWFTSKRFRELQPPMDIDIEEILKEPAYA